MVRARPFDWFPRSIISGFTATLAMAILFFIAYGAASVLSNIQLNARADTFAGWMRALTNNPVIHLAATSMYAAATMHLIIGIALALAYGYFLEPRLPGNGPVKGMWFALIPWALSVLVFLPLVGGGLLGAGLNAGPLPALGNLLLHLAYGATLGAVYGPLGDIPADDLSRAAPRDNPELIRHYEQNATRGILGGAVLGAIIGVAVMAMNTTSGVIFGLPALVFVPVTVAIGLIVGALWGSISGLTPPRMASPARQAFSNR